MPSEGDTAPPPPPYIKLAYEVIAVYKSLCKHQFLIVVEGTDKHLYSSKVVQINQPSSIDLVCEEHSYLIDKLWTIKADYRQTSVKIYSGRRR